MISMARIFGAPDTVPAGKQARNTSIAPSPSRSVALDLAHEVQHVAVALDAMKAGTRTEP
jgi:hypothetical protein